MSTVDHFKSRNILLPESTEKDFERHGVTEAEVDKNLLLPPLPSSFSIRDEMTPVRDQGQQGSCTSFCVAACLEHIHRRDLSEGHMQHEAETRYDDCVEGLAVVHSFEVAKSIGTVDEVAWPYDDSQVCWQTPPDITGQAKYKFNGYGYVYRRARPLVVEELTQASAAAAPGLPLTLRIQRQLFARRRPIGVSVPVFWSSWPWDGDVVMPTPEAVAAFLASPNTPDPDGWHCITIAGWDNSTARFTFKNSWGTFWGDAGYGTVPYQYIDAFSDLAIVGW